MLPLEIDLVVIGDELLDGHVRDANGHWLTERTRTLGIPVRRMLTVRDGLDDIVGALATCLADPHRPRVVLTSGGVGGTWDDLTYEAVARALGTTLRRDDRLAEPLDYILGYMEDLGYAMDDDAVSSMHRIATVPATARVVQHRRFLACTISDVDGGCHEGGVTIVTLPGPPGHFQSVVDAVVVPELLDTHRRDVAVEEVEHGYPEHVLAGALHRIQQGHPTVSMGSYPGDVMVVRVQGPPDEVAVCAAKVRAVVAEVDDHPAAEGLRDTWKIQAASWDGD